MTHQGQAEEIFESLRGFGAAEVEVYRKSGRSRRFETSLQGRGGSSSVEQGWAIRAGGPRSSLFVAGTGAPSADLKWPELDGQPLRLPAAVPVPAWRPAADLDASLVAESEAVALLTGIEKALCEEVPGSRVLLGQLEEGTSEVSILNTLGVDVGYRSRAAALYIEVVGPESGSSAVRLSLAERNHRAFQPSAIANRLANRLLLSRQGGAPARERGDVLIGSSVATRILASLMPVLLGAEAETLARSLADRQGRLGSSLLTIIDDGRLREGVLASPVDGEGLPSGPIVLVEEGRYRQALRSWREDTSAARPAIGCSRRESWRDLPRTWPSNLYIQPQRSVSISELLGSIARGFYLLEPLGPGVFDFSRDRFRLPVCGLVLRQGRASAPLARTWLEGSIGGFLRRIRAVARDLTFEPLGAMIGSPSLLVSGLDLRGMD